ncbi:MAG TPA: asparagine synthase (glutamine-hydrolyzing) [Pelobium sp.]
MCGITGFVDFEKEINLKNLKNAALQLSHRGPDDKGQFYIENEYANIGLASRRLSIIDLSSNGQQPMVSDCKNYILVFNGTIYNYKELRTKLSNLGYRFRSESDTEVLLACYKTWGNQTLSFINGVFAFCIYDKEKNLIIIARDNIGIKPLFYHYQNNIFSFSSEIKAIKNYGTGNLVDKDSLAFFLKHGYFPNHSSIFKNIKKVSPGEFLELDISTQHLSKCKFWEIPEMELGKINPDEDKIVDTSHELVKHSVISRTVADTNFGILLSGGIDSATTAAIAQKYSATPINTFTIGFEEQRLDESANARKIAAHLKTNHSEHILTKKEALETIKNIGKIYDEPMGDSGAIALFAAVKFAKTKVKVLLSSEGGDELFGGYQSYIIAKKWYRLFNILPKTKIFNFIHPKISSLLSSKSIIDFYNNINAYFTDEEIVSLITPTPLLIAETEVNGNSLNKMLFFDLNNYLPEDLLMKADRTCMYWGVENRDPLLDKNLVSYANQIPDKFKIKGNIKKYVLKEIAYKYIPKNLLNYPKKGFSIPVENWLKNDLKDFVLAELKDSSIYGLLDKQQVNYILSQFLKNKKGYYRKIWILLSLKLWANEHYKKNNDDNNPLFKN